MSHEATIEPETELVVPKRPRIWTALAAPFLAVIGAVILQIVFAIGLAGWLMSGGVSPAELGTRINELMVTPGIFLLVAALGQSAFAIVGFAMGRLSPVPFRERLGLRRPNQDWTIYPLTMLGSIPVLAVAIGAVYALTLVLEPDRTFERVFENMTPAWGVALVLFIAAAPGIFEELLFRGYTQTRLLQRWSPTTAILVTSVIFALAHVMPHAMLVAFPLGVWFGVIAWRTGSILPGMACHAFVNGGLNTWRLLVKFLEISEPVQWGVTIVALVIGTVCLGISWKRLMGGEPC